MVVPTIGLESRSILQSKPDCSVRPHATVDGRKLEDAWHRHDFLMVPEVGGALIGGASLKAKDFNAIIRTLPFQAIRAEHAAVA